MNSTYQYLSQLNCFEDLKASIPYMLDDLEQEMKWYEEESTEDDVEHLSRFLVCVYGDYNIYDWLEEIGVSVW